jgi:hypothetical protein
MRRLARRDTLEAKTAAREDHTMRIRQGLWVAFASVLALASSTAATDIAFAPFGPGYGPAVTFQIALGDLDADGDLDAVFANQGATPSRVLLNDGAGVFAYTDQRLTTQGHGAALGDLDGDGDLDLVVSCASVGGPGKPSKVYLNDGDATFTDTGQALGDTALSGNLVQLADIDVDGDLDAFIAYLTIPGREFVSCVFLNDGAGAFALSPYEFPFGTLFHDLDRDGDVDAFAKLSGVGYQLHANAGDGRCEATWDMADPSLWYEPFSFAFGDLDADGDVDIVDTNGSWTAGGPSFVLKSDGAGGFERSPLIVGSLRCAWPALADLDRDGDLDAAVTCMGEPDRIWLGDGKGGLTDSGLRLGGNKMTTGLAVGDLDGDGDLDLFIPVYGMTGGMAVVWLNQLRP